MLDSRKIARLHVGKRLSEAAIHNGVVYLAGMVPDDPSVGMTAQTESVLAGIDKLLAEADSDKTLILSATIWIRDMALFEQMNAAWDAWVPAGHAPPRATVEARLARPDYLVEIKVIAAQKS